MITCPSWSLQGVKHFAAIDRQSKALYCNVYTQADSKTLREEFYAFCKEDSIRGKRRKLKEFVDDDHKNRPHAGINNMTPYEYLEKTKSLKKNEYPPSKNTFFCGKGRRKSALTGELYLLSWNGKVKTAKILKALTPLKLCSCVSLRCRFN